MHRPCHWLLAFSALCAIAAQGQQPPHELVSPNKQYSVKMILAPMPGFDPYDTTLEVCAGERVLARHPTEGYLLDAFWSPDGKYVAVDNRRANSGDYCWVFRLSDGAALKRPDDLAPDGKLLDYDVA